MSSGSGLKQGVASFTHRSLEALLPKQAPYRVCDQRCTGLAIRVSSTGLKTWDLAYRIRGAGKVRRVSLGRFGDVSLEKARERANQLTIAARSGRDLIAEEKEAAVAAASRLTIASLVEVYIRRRVAGQLRTAREIERRLMRALGPILENHVADVRRRNIRELLDRVADEGLEREAEKRRQTIGAMFRWALSQDMVEADPTAGLTPYDPGMPRNRVLTISEIAKLWAWLDSDALSTEAAEILKLQLLTGARCGEISGMCKEEVDSTTWVWVLPAVRSKSNQQRATPLVGAARRIVDARLLTKTAGALFTNTKGSILTAAHVGNYLNARKKILPIEKFTTHDLRRTFATALAEMAVPFDLIAAVLGHSSGTRETRTLIRHYIHSDLIARKTEVLLQWGNQLQEIIGRQNI
jgi:integrase